MPRRRPTFNGNQSAKAPRPTARPRDHAGEYAQRKQRGLQRGLLHPRYADIRELARPTSLAKRLQLDTTRNSKRVSKPYGR